jgi:SAM-dependent methyltransferase
MPTERSTSLLVEPDRSVVAAFDAAPFDVLRRKWSEVPAAELLTLWERLRREATTGANFAVRGWYHTLYSDVLRGKRVLDVGCGLGIDTVTYLEAGASVVFLDIVPENLELVRRICTARNVADRAGFFLMSDFEGLANLPGPFDAIYAQGSLINMPRRQIEIEVAQLLRHLPIGGRWIELAYPRQRWEHDGSPPFSRWGTTTDGAGTPWVEWYDLEKRLETMAPARFEAILDLEFHGGDFVWFDLIRRA